MKKFVLAVLAIAIAISGLGFATPDGTFPITPTPLQPGNFGPDVYMAYRYIDIGSDVSDQSINPIDLRNHNYAFTGEKIYYYVLVRDDNGKEDIQQVRWTVDGFNEEGPCDEVTVDRNGCFETIDGQVCIDDATNLQYDEQIDKVYMCILTVESSWTGTSEIHVEAEDTGGEVGQTLSETWEFNPALSVSLSTSDGQPLTFGEIQRNQVAFNVDSNCERNINEGMNYRDCSLYEPSGQEHTCDVSFSTNKLVITNDGVVDLWPFIAASDFYDSTGMARCPDSNVLGANQFEYRAIQGSWDSGWRIMPKYSDLIGCTDPLGSCHGGCRITTGNPIDVLSPSHSIEIALKIVWPKPCIGKFDTGSIYAIVKAV